MLFMTLRKALLSWAVLEGESYHIDIEWLYSLILLVFSLIYHWLLITRETSCLIVWCHKPSSTMYLSILTVGITKTRGCEIMEIFWISWCVCVSAFLNKIDVKINLRILSSILFLHNTDVNICNFNMLKC